MPNRLLAPFVPGILAVALIGAAAAGLWTRTVAAQEDAPGSLTVLTVNGDDEPVPGACYDLFVDEDGPTAFVAEQCDAYDGAADGTTFFADIPSGDYVLVQIFVPAGYKTGKDRSLSIVAGEQAAYSFRTPRGGRAVTLALHDENAQPLPGGCYSLYPVDPSGQPGPALKVACDFYDGADDGIASFTGLDNGDYDIIVSSPPEGYTIPIGQSIKVGGGDLSLIFDVALGGETVTIANVDESGEPVPGSCHRLYTDAGDGARGELVVVGCDHADGANNGAIVIVGLLPGAYVLAGPSAPVPPVGDGSAGGAVPTAPAGPAGLADIPFEVIEGEGAQVEVVNQPAETGTPSA